MNSATVAVQYDESTSTDSTKFAAFPRQPHARSPSAGIEQAIAELHYSYLIITAGVALDSQLSESIVEQRTASSALLVAVRDWLPPTDTDLSLPKIQQLGRFTGKLRKQKHLTFLPEFLE